MSSSPGLAVPAVPRGARASRRATQLVAAVLGLGAALTLTGAAAAVSPERDGADRSIDVGGRHVSPDTGPQGQGPRGAGSKVSRGYDVSYPQCARQLPLNPAFAIVGVNGGKSFSVNPCLGDELAWGGGATAELYANTGNPGPTLSSFWPSGQTSPRFCDAANPDTADCAYDYGWNSAQHSFQTVQSAYAMLQIAATPAATGWWLDVETSNSWRSRKRAAFNVAALQGEIDAFRNLGVTRLGIYSNQYQWNRITGGSAAFAAYPSWLAGGRTLKGARQLCTRPAFSGGATVMAQYFAAGFDADLPC